MLAAGLRGELAHFTVDLESLDTAAHVVSELIRISYPDVTSRSMRAGAISWSAGATSGPSARRNPWASPAAKARAEFDLAITSVLLDAGAGPSWRYLDPATGRWSRAPKGSASRACAFSRPAPSRPIRPTAARRRRAADAAESRRRCGRLSKHGRQSACRRRRSRWLLASLGGAVAAKPDVFAREDHARPGGLYDHLARKRRTDASRRRAFWRRCSSIWGRSGRAG